MKAGTTIRKILFIALWVVIGGAMFSLLMAAISKKNKGSCRDYVITMKVDPGNMFMSREDISVLLEELMGGPVKGQPISSFKLRDLENSLEANSWIDRAELYFDNRDVLHVSVDEKIPVARVFTTGGRSFYVDSLANTMPLSEKKTARVPVFTGFPHKQQLSLKDSILLTEIANTASFIVNDPFWNAQVSQIDILADRTFELIPVVGDHRVKLGNGTDIAAKFRRLFVFYRQVLSNTGLNAYKTIDVQYKGQVVASRQYGEGRIDSIQLRKNVEKLLRQAGDMNQDTVVHIRPLPLKPILPDEEPPVKTELPEENKNSDPNPVKTKSVSPAKSDMNSKDEGERTKLEKRVPKAVMPPKKTNENQ